MAVAVRILFQDNDLEKDIHLFIFHLAIGKKIVSLNSLNFIELLVLPKIKYNKKKKNTKRNKNLPNNKW